VDHEEWDRVETITVEAPEATFSRPT